MTPITTCLDAKFVALQIVIASEVVYQSYMADHPHGAAQLVLQISGARHRPSIRIATLTDSISAVTSFTEINPVDLTPTFYFSKNCP